jgi:hypothetical protein
MGVKLWDGGFRSHHAAELAGKQALEDFLNGLSIEARSKSLSVWDELLLERELLERDIG